VRARPRSVLQQWGEAPLSPTPLKALAVVARLFPGQRNGKYVSALRFIGMEKTGASAKA